MHASVQSGAVLVSDATFSSWSADCEASVCSGVILAHTVAVCFAKRNSILNSFTGNIAILCCRC